MGKKDREDDGNFRWGKEREEDDDDNDEMMMKMASDGGDGTQNQVVQHITNPLNSKSMTSLQNISCRCFI